MNMKPLIGICTSYVANGSFGVDLKMGIYDQEWNVLQQDYIESIESAGGIPVIVPIIEDQETLQQLISKLDGILFTGGADIDPQHYGETPSHSLGSISPKRDFHELQLAQYVLNETTIPILGICRGLQVLTVATGGSLYQDLQADKKDSFSHIVKGTPKWYAVHTASIAKNSRFASIFNENTIRVNSFHHQSVKQIGEGFVATMHAEDGVVEGIELDSERFVCAVQWHPEMMARKVPEISLLFQAFVEAAK